MKLDPEVKELRKENRELLKIIDKQNKLLGREMIKSSQFKKTVYELFLIRLFPQVLTPRQLSIIELRFGFITGNTSSLEEVGNVFEVTRERIRQTEAKAIEKIRKIKVSFE